MSGRNNKSAKKAEEEVVLTVSDTESENESESEVESAQAQAGDKGVETEVKAAASDEESADVSEEEEEEELEVEASQKNAEASEEEEEEEEEEALEASEEEKEEILEASEEEEEEEEETVNHAQVKPSFPAQAFNYLSVVYQNKGKIALAMGFGLAGYHQDFILDTATWAVNNPQAVASLATQPISKFSHAFANTMADCIEMMSVNSYRYMQLTNHWFPQSWAAVAQNMTADFAEKPLSALASHIREIPHTSTAFVALAAKDTISDRVFSPLFCAARAVTNGSWRRSPAVSDETRASNLPTPTATSCRPN